MPHPNPRKAALQLWRGRTAHTRGSNHIRYWADDLVVRLTTDGPVSYIAEEVWFVLDQPIDLILAPDETIAGSVSDAVRKFPRADRRLLEGLGPLPVDPVRMAGCGDPRRHYAEALQFRGVGRDRRRDDDFDPRRPGTWARLDYRFCWVRDAYFVVEALNRLGATLTMEDFIRYVTNIAAIDPGPAS